MRPNQAKTVLPAVAYSLVPHDYSVIHKVKQMHEQTHKTVLPAVAYSLVPHDYSVIHKVKQMHEQTHKIVLPAVAYSLVPHDYSVIHNRCTNRHTKDTLIIIVFVYGTSNVKLKLPFITLVHICSDLIQT